MLRHCTVFLIGFWLVFQVPAQSGSVLFDQLTIEDGLPQNSVTSIIQDSHGFMWFGTQDGLCRYDGTHFLVYRSKKNDPSTLSHNFIWDITEDSRGILWIATLGNGLNRLDPKTGAITRYLHYPDSTHGLSNHNVFATCFADNHLWVGTNNGLDQLDEQTGRCKYYFHRSEMYDEGRALNLIRKIAFDPPHSLRMNTDQGLTFLDIATEEVQHFEKSPFGLDVDMHQIKHLEQRGDWLLVMTSSHLMRINFKLRREEMLFTVDEMNLEKPPELLKMVVVNDFVEWIGTSGGVIRRDRGGNGFALYTHNPEDNRSLAHNYVLSVCQSKDGVLWVGTRNGLSKLNRTRPNFELYRNKGEEEFALSDKSVQCIVEDAQDRLWIGTHNGLNILDRTSGKIQKVKRSQYNVNTLASDYVLCMARDRRDGLWVGTKNGGLHRVENPNADRDFVIRMTSLGPSSVHSILPDDSLIWVGTGGDGLYKCDASGKVLRHYPAQPDGMGPLHSYVYQVFKDSRENYWLATPTEGLHLFDPCSEYFTAIQSNPLDNASLSGNTVLSIFEDSRNRLWVGTTSGLSRMRTPLIRNMHDTISDVSHFRFDHFGREHGFPNEVIYGIVEDDQHQLWISTNNGLVHFDPDEGQVLRAYFREDGCQGNEYNQNAYGRNSRGELYFGGVSGMHIFHPDSIFPNSFVPPVAITDVLLNYESVPITSNAGFSLGVAPHHVQNLNLNYNQNVVSFEFAAFSYVNHEQNRFAWQLEGFDPDWNFDRQNRMVTYTNLDPGQYTFRVKAANNDGLWNEQGAVILVTVNNPPWKSWYAYMFYALLTLGILYVIVRTRTQKAIRKMKLQTAIARAREEEREMFRKKSAQDFHDEMGNKITRINLLVELARGDSDKSPHVREYLEKIENNTAELSSGMRDFNWAIDPEKDTLYELVLRIQSFGESLFDGGEVIFETKGSESIDQAIKLPMQMRRNLLLIFKEAINNVARHAKASIIELQINVVDAEDIHICVSDNGCGFNHDSTNRVGYGLKNMRERAARHGMRWTISTAPDKGTAVCVKFKIPHLGEVAESSKR